MSDNLASFHDSRIPILVPQVPTAGRLQKYLELIDSSRRYSNFGVLETELRRRFSEVWQVSIEQVRTACNATLALQGAVETSEEPHLGWQVPSWTFPATPLALHHANINYEFVDIVRETWRATFTPGKANVVDVLPFGDAFDLDRLEALNLRNVVIDGAASAGSLLQHPLPESKVKYGLILSLHATKLLPAGEGAVFATNCPKWAERFKKWTNFGFEENRVPALLGTNAKLSEYASAVALASLDGFKQTVQSVKSIQKIALRIANEFGFPCHPAMEKMIPNPYWIISTNSKAQKDYMKTVMQDSNIETRDWWGIGCHKNPLFAHRGADLPNTDFIAATSLGLPFHEFLTDEDFLKIQEALSRAI